MDLSGDYLSRLVKLGYQQAEHIILKKQDSLIPVFLIVRGDGETEIIGAPFDDEVQKLVVFQAVRLKLRKTNAKAYSFIAEAWASAQGPGWQEGDPHIPASEATNRIEKVVCYAVSCDGDKRYGSWTIQRDEAGKCTALLEDETADRISGRVVALFE